MSDDSQVEIWKIRKLIKSLQSARGSGTSMISLIIPADGNIPSVTKMLTTEAGTASNVKSRVNRLSIMSAITSVQVRLKTYNCRLPKNGLAIYCGTIVTEEGKEKKITIDFEPFRPVKRFLYHCDNRFHTDPLESLLEDNEVFGFIIIDGNGVLIAKLQGNSYDILYEYGVDLMTKTRRGGQSAKRFEHLRDIQRNIYLKQSTEKCNHHFIGPDGKVNVKGIVLGGCGVIKDQFVKIDELRPAIKKAFIGPYDLAYGGKNGLNQAIKLAASHMSNVKLLEEMEILGNFYEQISTDSGLYCFGINEIMYCLEAGAVSKLIVWEELDTTRYVYKDSGESERITYKPLIEAIDPVESKPLTEWLTENYKSFGIELVFVSDKSQDGSQFCKGFGGLGAILRYKVDMSTIQVADEYGNDLGSDLEEDFM
jgi:peptide chain release factor subunit 1